MSTDLSILFIVANIHGWAGTERVLHLIANNLPDSIKVTILSIANTKEKPGGCRGYPYSKKVKIMYWQGTRSLIGILAANLFVQKLIKNNKYKIVILVGLGEIKYCIYSTVLAAVAKVKRTQFLGWEHFNASFTYKRINRKLAALFCHTIIVLTNQDKEDWQRLLRPRARLVVMPNPIPHFPTIPATLDGNRILAMGRLEKQKRFDKLLLAFALFCQRKEGWKLRIRGDGSLESELQKQIKNLHLDSVVELLPATPNVSQEYKDASMFILTSDFEGFPMTLLEAMSFGVPPISFDCPNGPAEIIKNGVDGYLIPKNDIDALVHKMLLLADNTIQRKAFGTATRENIKRYDLALILEKWQHLLYAVY